MLSCWEVLRDAGVPDGAVRPSGQGRLDPSSTAAALREAVENLERLDMTERECLAAWLGAFRHHWPDRFEAVLGSGGDAAVQRLGGEPLDHGRYLKLRRIAIANLSGLV